MSGMYKVLSPERTHMRKKIGTTGGPASEASALTHSPNVSTPPEKASAALSRVDERVWGSDATHIADGPPSKASSI